MSAAQDPALVHRANLNIAAAVVAKLGTSAPDSLIGNVINDVRASHSVTELASAGGMSMVAGAVDSAIARNIETGRPFNVTDSRAAQLVALSGHPGGHWHHEGASLGRYGLLGANRGNRETAGDAVSDGNGSAGGAGRGGYAGTGSEPAGAAFWGTAKGQMLTRGYANDNNMNWAPPDLMKLGRPALQALKESGLKSDGYKALRDPSGLHFDNATIVAGAKGYMRRNRVNDNEASKASAAVDRLAMPRDMRARHRDAVAGIRTSTLENETERREASRKSGDEIEQHDPAHKDAVARERRGYKLDQGNAPKADAAAKKDEAEAKQKGDKAATAKQEAKASTAGALAALRSAPKMSN